MVEGRYTEPVATLSVDRPPWSAVELSKEKIKDNGEEGGRATDNQKRWSGAWQRWPQPHAEAQLIGAYTGLEGAGWAPTTAIVGVPAVA